MKCNMCESEMKYKETNGTHIWVCKDCSNVQFEYYNKKNLIDLGYYLEGFVINNGFVTIDALKTNGKVRGDVIVVYSDMLGKQCSLAYYNKFKIIMGEYEIGGQNMDTYNEYDDFDIDLDSFKTIDDLVSYMVHLVKGE